ncbi:hypothetical protein PybrP1_007487, partial [[Pythium] brassicae (nom. inval.)]
MIEVLFIAAAVLATAAFLIAYRSGRRDTRADLRAPLLPVHAAGDHRVEAAVRDAELGFMRCSVCAFENFKRFPFCSLCGQALEQPEPAQDHSPTGDAAPLTQRQKRVRTRREWVRKLDIEGKLFWFRDTVSGVASSARAPAFCVGFSSPEAPALASASSCEPGHRDVTKGVPPAGPATTSSSFLALVDTLSAGRPEPLTTERSEGDAKRWCSPQPRPLRLDDVLRVLLEGTRGLTVRLTEAATADPAQPPLTIAIAATGPSPSERASWSRRQIFYLNPHSARDIGANHLLYFFGAGRLIGRALLEGQSLMWLQDNAGVDALGLTFSLTEVLASGETVE